MCLCVCVYVQAKKITEKIHNRRGQALRQRTGKSKKREDDRVIGNRR